jgi:uncharacterized protein
MNPSTANPAAYTLEIVQRVSEINPTEWNGLLSTQSGGRVFMQYHYLCALEASASAHAATGWSPQFLTLREAGKLVAACPLYLKAHSYGEFVFDWAWADAYQRHGLAYYPKIVSSVPFTPVPGPRLLARTPQAKTALLQALQQLAQEQGLSSAHLLFLNQDDADCAKQAGWMLRRGVQFHWVNRSPAPYADFTEFLSCLQREKRKKIQQERKRVVHAGVSFTVHLGAEITDQEWHFFYRCHEQTYREHGNNPYLSSEFFQYMAQHMPEHWLLFIAWQNGQRIACSLLAIDPEQRTAYGRYWGALVHVPQLHFEACYYQPLAWCIEHQYQSFEGGAQGEHKMARGLLPVQTYSAHWLAHPQFSQAVANFLAQEGQGMAQYMNELHERKPFKA